MKITIQEQDIDIDLEEVAYKAANGDVIAFGKMLCEFCEHLQEREKKAGYSDLRYFDTVFGILVEYLDESQFKKLEKIVKEVHIKD